MVVIKLSSNIKIYLVLKVFLNPSSIARYRNGALILIGRLCGQSDIILPCFPLLHIRAPWKPSDWNLLVVHCGSAMSTLMSWFLRFQKKDLTNSEPARNCFNTNKCFFSVDPLQAQKSLSRSQKKCIRLVKGGIYVYISSLRNVCALVATRSFLL